jgi:hypothetical protein
MLACSTCTEAPATGKPPVALVTAPLIVPAPTPNVRPLLVRPPTVTVTSPVVAPAGTGTLMLELLQALGTAATPLKDTVLESRKAPKFDPVMTTAFPTDPEVGEMLAKSG